MSIPVECAVKISSTVATNNIAQSQSPGAAGNLTLNGTAVTAGVATLVVSGAAQVIITSAADDHTRTFTIYGTDESGIPISESLLGTAIGVSTSVLFYKTVTRIAVDQATAGAVIAGTNGVAVTRWVNFDVFSDPVSIIASNVVTGSVNYGLEYTYGTDPLSSTVVPDAAYTNGKTSNTQSGYTLPMTWLRCKLNSGSGSVTMTTIQAGPEGG